MSPRAFWLTQLTWWAFCAAMFHLQAMPTLIGASGAEQLAHLGAKVLKAAVGALASLVLHQLYRRVLPRLGLPALTATALAASFGLGVLWELVNRLMAGRAPVDDQLLRGAMLPAFVLTAWSAFFFSSVFRERESAERQRATQAVAVATQAELAMLRYQVNPHFLFNALNALRALIDENPAAARTMVTQLAELFRHALRTTDAPLTLGDELAAIRSYLDIQKLRFDEGLEFQLEADEVALGTALPGFLVHPLVENAIKYGLQTSAAPLKVRVSATRAARGLEIVVSNSGKWLDAALTQGAGTGTGLRNLRARLAHLFPDKHALELGEAAGLVQARLRLEVD